MIPEPGLFIIGVSGFIVFYAVLAHLSARMGEGLRLPRYYRIFYVSILIQVVAAVYSWYQYAGERPDEVPLILLIVGNILTIGASYKYWWWLKDELWMKREKADESDE